ncbi:hypothetical protein RhiirC2_797683 [Rhizophagus irregularis]|uniref:Uncharacterized protein n=1 Tax=Rhizophagus irregularis TaxID=588596 RepID=A0A2N1M7M5_9GLOM|nr:hypothetical protein RhiirC2_797683 [Rhizophagus irregularis]
MSSICRNSVANQFLHQKVIVLKDAASVVRNMRDMETVVVMGNDTGTRGMETVAMKNVRKAKVEMIEVNIVVTIEVEIAIAKAYYDLEKTFFDNGFCELKNVG